MKTKRSEKTINYYTYIHNGNEKTHNKITNPNIIKLQVLEEMLGNC